MNNVTLRSIQARYKELFPINCPKEDFIKALEYFKQVDDKRFIVTCSEVNYKPYMIAYLLKYLSTHDRYPEILVLNAHEVSEIYITGNQEGNLLRLSDIKADILFLTNDGLSCNYEDFLVEIECKHHIKSLSRCF